MRGRTEFFDEEEVVCVFRNYFSEVVDGTRKYLELPLKMREFLAVIFRGRKRESGCGTIFGALGVEWHEQKWKMKTSKKFSC